jgi:hypothetical protein
LRHSPSRLEQARERYKAKGPQGEALGRRPYQAKSWERERRVVYKAEAMEDGTNRQFVITNGQEGPSDLYDWCGEAENRINDVKPTLKADRESCRRFQANRLLLHAAY